MVLSVQRAYKAAPSQLSRGGFIRSRGFGKLQTKECLILLPSSVEAQIRLGL